MLSAWHTGSQEGADARSRDPVTGKYQETEGEEAVRSRGGRLKAVCRGVAAEPNATTNGRPAGGAEAVERGEDVRVEAAWGNTQGPVAPADGPTAGRPVGSTAR